MMAPASMHVVCASRNIATSILDGRLCHSDWQSAREREHRYAVGFNIRAGTFANYIGPSRP